MIDLRTLAICIAVLVVIVLQVLIWRALVDLGNTHHCGSSHYNPCHVIIQK